MVVREVCPACGSTQFKKNGHIHSGNQHHQRTTCGRQFVASATERIISHEQRTLIEHLLRERISLHGISRAVRVSRTWLLHFMVERFAACPDHLHVQLPVRPTDVAIRRLEAEADELWSFGRTGNGSGWRWMPRRVRSSRFTWAIGVVKAPTSCGPRFLRCTVSRQPSIRINTIKLSPCLHSRLIHETYA
jgi:transposase-like protein